MPSLLSGPVGTETSAQLAKEGTTVVSELTNEQLDELEAKHAAATPGPYRVELTPSRSALLVDDIVVCWSSVEHNAEYLALVANLAPALVAEVRRLRAGLEERVAERTRHLLRTLLKKDRQVYQCCWDDCTWRGWWSDAGLWAGDLWLCPEHYEAMNQQYAHYMTEEIAND